MYMWCTSIKNFIIEVQFGLHKKTIFRYHKLYDVNGNNNFVSV